MPRLLHMADVHLGARHGDLAEAAALQRERQFDAFRRAIDAALEQSVDVVLICGDLFDSNGQPPRTVDRATTELRRLTDRGIRVVLIPGTHDAYDAGSLYRVFDLRQRAGLPDDSNLLTVLTSDRRDIVFPELDLVVYGRVFDTKRAPRSPLADFFTVAETRARWKVAMVHGAMFIPGKVENDDVIFTEAEVAASGLDYLALGHWHSFLEGRAGTTTWAYSGAPEPVAVDQDGAGQVCLVTLTEQDGVRSVEVKPLTVGRTRFTKLDVDAAEVGSQTVLIERLRALADPDLVLDARLVGISADSLEVNEDDVSAGLAGSFLRVRFRDLSVAALPEGALPPPDTIAGRFILDMEARIAASEKDGNEAAVAEARAALRLGRRLLDDPRLVTLA